ncbi:hypothetical protein P171DRAFT_496834 [Karstenula rhodostoma CBS 690.94]|uniref:F-box domain-containing protein n=1 Tax=Karstenula rhodostoma CBS 690.94 TaxID=1392251 RepID=A0A9P4PDV8_9PLEO|nr:hypothetical protein P171DRAFT_496834 [Karstenula rhodostoma CBS 690.94]
MAPVRLLDLPGELRNMVFDEVLLMPCDELANKAFSAAGEQKMENLTDQAHGRLWETPWEVVPFSLPPCNPALNLALANHQLRDEVMGRAKAMGVSFAANYREGDGKLHKLRKAPHKAFTWQRPMPIALPTHSPIEYVDINLAAGDHTFDLIGKTTLKFLVNIISNGSARSMRAAPYVQRGSMTVLANPNDWDFTALPVYTIREARVNITSYLLSDLIYDISIPNFRERLFANFYLTTFCYLPLYSTEFEALCYVMSHVGKFVVSVDGEHFQDIDLGDDARHGVLGPMQELGDGPADSGFSALIRAVIKEHRRRAGFGGASLPATQQPFMVPAVPEVDPRDPETDFEELRYGRTFRYNCKTKIIRQARNLGFIVHVVE